MSWLSVMNVRYSVFFCSSGNKEACVHRLFVGSTSRTEESVTKRVFGYSTLFFIAVTCELPTYFFPFRFHFQYQFGFHVQDSIVFFLVTGLFWLLFLCRRYQAPFYRLRCFCSVFWLSPLFKVIFKSVLDQKDNGREILECNNGSTIDLLAILQKSLDRVIFLYNFIREVRLSGVRASIPIVHIRKSYKI